MEWKCFFFVTWNEIGFRGKRDKNAVFLVGNHENLRFKPGRTYPWNIATDS